MKRVLCFFVACMLLLTVAYASDVVDADTKLIQWGIAATAKMIENAETNAKISPALLKSWKEIDVSQPGKALVLTLPESQAEDACKALGVESFFEVAPVLSETINMKFWEVYAKGAVLAKAEIDEIDVDESPMLIILTYGNHIAAASSANGKMQASFIISSEEISDQLSEQDILTYTDQLRLSYIEIRMYEGEKLEEMLNSSAEPAFSEESAQFTFRNGISFGMSEEQLIQTEEKQNQMDKTTWKSMTLNDWHGIANQETKVKVSSYEANIIYLLYDNKMEVATYDFTSNADETMYDTISKAVSAVYGEGEPVTAKEIMLLLDCFSPGYYKETDILHGLVWKLGNVVVYQYYYGNNSFALMYTNPNFDYDSTKPVDTTGI